MQKTTLGFPRRIRNPFRKRGVRGTGLLSVNSACCFASEHGLGTAIAHAREVAARVCPGMRVLEPVLRQEILADGHYLLVVVEVPEMSADEFGECYDAFMDGVWGELPNLDPALVTFSVQTRVSA